VINQPADLEIFFKGNRGRAVVAVEVSNVNAPQLVGGVGRLYLDTCPLKLLVIVRSNNSPREGKGKAERLFCLLYGQAAVIHTPARVVWFGDEEALTIALSDLLLLSDARDQYKP
jgi:hypothetical protein